MRIPCSQQPTKSWEWERAWPSLTLLLVGKNGSLKADRNFLPSLIVAGIGNIPWRLMKLSKTTAARAAAKQSSGKTVSRRRDLGQDQEVPVGPDLPPHPGLCLSLWQQHSPPRLLPPRRAVRLKGMAHWSNLPGCMTITDTDAPVSIWALLSVLVTAMGVPGGDSSRHRPVALWGWEGAMTAWAWESRSRLRGCPCSRPSSSLFIRVFSCLPSPHSSLCYPHTVAFPLQHPSLASCLEIRDERKGHCPINFCQRLYILHAPSSFQFPLVSPCLNCSPFNWDISHCTSANKLHPSQTQERWDGADFRRVRTDIRNYWQTPSPSEQFW